MTRKPEPTFNNYLYSKESKSFTKALFEECKRRNYEMGNISTDDKELITVKYLSTAMEKYEENKEGNKTIADLLEL